ncbi:DNA polymerase III subunit chi [sulfur-oxidizing endosymbiont of Gigantopelta aegis]|uniref:DNA polymerase III subunit chi n=1 Tax=sulfur-oxidizing endosymbiont of Gigantopelta aegis TaxID=2794934 RepID=UPI0018DDC036|nr:DNA polymerase III subunit chi [sulfur-oxidizing endosymbiont of Gigantopelta aegis]
MTQVDFYILGENSQRQITSMVCRLCEKALAQELSVLIYVASPADAQQMDDLLWTYKANSFIAHSSHFTQTKLNSDYFYPVFIHYPTAADKTDVVPIRDQYKQLLINLTTEIPSFFQKFTRMAEMVGKNNEEKAIARNRYRTYLQQGLSLNKYDL